MADDYSALVRERIDGRCQFCGIPTRNGTDFCTASHFELWVRHDELDEALRRAVQALCEAVRSLQPAFAEAVKSISEAYRALVEAGLVAAEPPADPMARALHLRRHRNTGPKLHADPRLNR